MLPVTGDSAYFLELYARYRRDRASVPADWALHFEMLDGVNTETPSAGGSPADALAAQALAAWRDHGHLEADLDPLGLAPRRKVPGLEALRAALDARAGEAVGLRLGGAAPGRLGQLRADLDRIYCGDLGLQAGHIDDEDLRGWVLTEFERLQAAEFGTDDLARSARAVGLADLFETFVRTKYPTKKRFGSEGSEGSVVLLGEILRLAAKAGCGEAVMGGMHRGRLAMLATVLGKPLAMLLAEIVGRDLTDGGPDYTGDVPYHLGHTNELDFEGAKLRVELAPHPSHLSVVAPVAAGLARARRSAGRAADPVCVLLHTDAAFAGQGVIAELMQLSGLDGYRTGGSIHIVVNNQIGFTTLPSEGRTATYCTDIGKMIGVPVLHVNGDSPVALARAAALAFAWRQYSGRDVIIDLVCYRRNGHNELDEPRFTQPQMWRNIDARPTLAVMLSDQLAARDPVAHARLTEELAGFRAGLVDGFEQIDTFRPNNDIRFQSGWSHLSHPDEAALLARVPTGLPRADLIALARATSAPVAGISPHAKVTKFYEARLESIETGEGINFATAEAMAFASLLAEGHPLRMSGQDCVRGTFTQRHLQLHDLDTGRTAFPLEAAAAMGKARFEVINSPLSEYSVLGFEYGHSLEATDTLTLWEAQFGDFLNGAQIVVDQFIVSAEAKWQLRSGMVLLLPHGLEGQGPDHSSARTERILQLCANGNILVANPSTPANYFHLLRRQIHAPWRKPLFVIAPKSLLRARACASTLDQIADGTAFEPVIGDGLANPARVGGVILCSGKIYYDLLQARAEAGLEDQVALIRIEQLYPLDKDAILRELGKFAGAGKFVWCQEEPQNQGAWNFVATMMSEWKPDMKFRYVGRMALPVSAGGSIDRHVLEQADIVARALQTAKG